MFSVFNNCSKYGSNHEELLYGLLLLYSGKFTKNILVENNSKNEKVSLRKSANDVS